MHTLAQNKEDLYKFFPIPSIDNFATSGYSDGHIIKFKTFYLKIYDIDGEMSYKVFGFDLIDSEPVFKAIVPMNEFREFASKFTSDNHLCEFRNNHVFYN